jgi:hypothetical protein
LIGLFLACFCDRNQLSTMKFNVAAAAASAAFLVGVNAEDQKVLKDESSSVAESATQAAPELPTFTVSVPGTARPSPPSKLQPSWLASPITNCPSQIANRSMAH